MSEETFYRRRLPHLRREGATYSVTWRVHRRQKGLLDVERTTVMSALKHFDDERYDLLAAVVMDDHVHLAVTPFAGVELSKLIGTWKKFSSRRICAGSERTAPLWQDEYSLSRRTRRGGAQHVPSLSRAEPEAALGGCR